MATQLKQVWLTIVLEPVDAAAPDIGKVASYFSHEEILGDDADPTAHNFHRTRDVAAPAAMTATLEAIYSDVVAKLRAEGRIP